MKQPYSKKGSTNGNDDDEKDDVCMNKIDVIAEETNDRHKLSPAPVAEENTSTNKPSRIDPGNDSGKRNSKKMQSNIFHPLGKDSHDDAAGETGRNIQMRFLCQ